MSTKPFRSLVPYASLLAIVLSAAPVAAQRRAANPGPSEAVSARPFGPVSDQEDRRYSAPAAVADLWTTGVGGFGRAAIDGILDPKEWLNAGRVDFLINLPGGGITPASFFVMNNRKQLYVALRLRQPAMPAASTVSMELDANGDGVLSDGDDGLLLNPDAGVGFVDLVRTSASPCPPNSLCGFFDTTVGGTADGSGAFGNDGTYTVYEMAHPLNSGDPNDIAMKRGQVIAFFVSFRLITGNVIADTNFPFYTLFLSKIRIH